MLKLDALAEPLEPGILIAELVHGIRAAAETEPHELRANDYEQRTADERVDEERVSEHGGSSENESHQDHSHGSNDCSWEQEEEVRVIYEHQAQVAPAVP